MEEYKINNYKKELKTLFRDYLETAKLDDHRQREVINEDNFESLYLDLIRWKNYKGLGDVAKKVYFLIREDNNIKQVGILKYFNNHEGGTTTEGYISKIIKRLIYLELVNFSYEPYYNNNRTINKTRLKKVWKTFI